MVGAESNNENHGTFLVVDGHSLAFRAFFALPVENFTNSNGQPTNAVWGFFSMLSEVIKTEKPDHIAVAFDVAGGTFRNKMLPQYKGTRDAAPEDLLSQLPLIQDLLKALGVIYIEKPGYEGDDIIGTLASMGEDAGCKTLVLSGDRDAFQLIDDNITMLYPGHHFKDLGHMTSDVIVKKYKVTPQQYPDLAAMRGEGADNIPGVPGVGDGYAAKWINEYGSLQGIFDHADEIGGKKGQSLRDNIDQVKLNRKVNAVVRDLDLGVKVEDLTLGGVDTQETEKVFNKLQFGKGSRKRIIDVFSGYSGKSGANHAADGQDIQTDGSAPTIVNDDDASNAGSLRQPASEPEMPQVTHITDPGSLRSWAKKAFADFGSQREDESSEQVDEATTSDDGSQFQKAPTKVQDRSDGARSNTGAMAPVDADVREEVVSDATQFVDRSLTCSQVLDHSWVLVPQGKAKPGDERLDNLLLLVGEDLALIPANVVGPCREQLQKLVDRYHDAVVVHGYKESLHLLGSVDIDLPMPLFDTKLAGYLVEPDFHADNLEAAAEHFLGGYASSEQQQQGELDLDGTGSGEEDESGLIAAAMAVRSLVQTLKSTIDARHQFGLLKCIELPVSQALYRLESAGAKVDLERLHHMLDDFSAQADQAQGIAWEAAGHELNLQSPKQLRAVLFDEMNLKPSRKTKSGSYTTNAATLQDLYVKYANDDKASTFLGALLQHRETNKLKQIVQTLLDSVNMHDTRIHTTFEQTVAATGRLSSVDPNLQNIPNRNAQGREIRSGFVPGEGFESLLSCDYSQVELRIMADLSGDEALIEAFKSGADFHKYVASLVYDLPMDQISSDQRSHVKAMSYGLAYGLSTYGLAKQLKISPAEADVLKAKYFATFGKVHTYLESLVSEARIKGYTETMFGRRRYFPGLKSTRRQVRDAAERAALNAPIQGSAADIMKIAMIRADRALRKAGVKSRVILQIHDELVLEVAPGEQDKVSALVRDAMEHAVDLAVPLDVSIGIGPDWQAAAH